jgi:hypothetical protein
MEKEVLTLTEAAKLLRVTPEALSCELERGTVPGRRINGDWRFRRTALLDWLGGREETKNGRGVEQEHPLARFAGIFKDDTLFEEVVATIEAESERQRQEAIREAEAQEKRKSAKRTKTRKQRKAA